MHQHILLPTANLLLFLLLFCRYVPTHLHLMVFELVKNSLRAVQERFMDSDKVSPSIRIIVADGIEDVTIKVQSSCLNLIHISFSSLWKFHFMSESVLLDIHVVGKCRSMTKAFSADKHLILRGHWLLFLHDYRCQMRGVASQEVVFPKSSRICIVPRKTPWMRTQILEQLIMWLWPVMAMGFQSAVCMLGTSVVTCKLFLWKDTVRLSFLILHCVTPLSFLSLHQCFLKSFRNTRPSGLKEMICAFLSLHSIHGTCIGQVFAIIGYILWVYYLVIFA